MRNLGAGGGGLKCSDMRHVLLSNLINSPCDIEANKQQRYDATLQFLKIDMRNWGLPIKGPFGCTKL